MAAPFIEHVNITVSDAERAARILTDLFGWRERWRGPAKDGGSTIHVGSDEAYVAIYTEKHEDGTPKGYAKGAPLNHIGVQVDDLDAVEAKAIALGLTPFSHGDYAPGRRFYILDADGVEYEIVSYAEARPS